jgi:hypothetical protein
MNNYNNFNETCAFSEAPDLSAICLLPTIEKAAPTKVAAAPQAEGFWSGLISALLKGIATATVQSLVCDKDSIACRAGVNSLFDDETPLVTAVAQNTMVNSFSTGSSSDSDY